MKKTIKVLGIIALIAVIGFSMTACNGKDNGGGDGNGNGGGNGGGSGGTLTVTGIPSKYNGKYAYFTGTNLNDPTNSNGGFQLTNGTSGVPRCVQISNESVSLPLWSMVSLQYVGYSGNHTVYGNLSIYNSSAMPNQSTNPAIAACIWESLTFSNGSATKTWDSGTSGDL